MFSLLLLDTILFVDAQNFRVLADRSYLRIRPKFDVLSSSENDRLIFYPSAKEKIPCTQRTGISHENSQRNVF